MLLIVSRPGTAVKLEDPAIQCSTQLLSMRPEDSINFDTHRSIVTRLMLGQQSNVQFLHALGSLIYIYAFGEKMGTIGLSGLSFGCGCTTESDITAPPQSGPGAESMLKWYNENRVSKREDPVRITIGSTAIEGFVVGITEDVVDTPNQIVQWNLTLASLPGDV